MELSEKKKIMKKFLVTLIMVVLLLSTNAQISISGKVVQPICPSCTGEIEVVATGGVSPYEYRLYDNNLSVFTEWQVNGLFTNLEQGFYNIQIKDSVKIDGVYGPSLSILYESGSVMSDDIGEVIDTLVCENKEYPLVKIGSQVWFQKNLDVGVKVKSNNPVAPLSNNGIIEKWCFNNSDCSQFGGLYTWEEAINYHSNKDICPEEFRIPSNSDWATLYAGKNGLSFGVGGSSKLEILKGGYSNGNGGYYNENIYGVFWKSDGAYNKGYRVAYTNRFISGLSPNVSDAYSIRCMKDVEPQVKEFEFTPELGDVVVSTITKNTLSLEPGWNSVRFITLKNTNIEMLFGGYTEITQIKDMETPPYGSWIPQFGLNTIGDLKVDVLYMIKTKKGVLIPLN